MEVSLSHTLLLRFRRTPALSFTPGRNPGPATHGMRPSIDTFEAPLAPEGRRKTRRKESTICNCRKGISEHLNEALGSSLRHQTDPQRRVPWSLSLLRT